MAVTMPFVFTKLVRLFTMKSMKLLKEIMTLLWTREIEALLLFAVLAHGIARSFMVDSLDWLIPMSPG